MNNISPQLKAHYQQATTTLAQCWKVTLSNGTVLGFTSNSANITFPPPNTAYGGVQVGSPVTYLAASGYTPSNIQSSSAMNVDNLECEGILSSPSITDAALIAGVWDYAQIQLIEVNYKDLTMGCRIVRTGNIGQVSTGRNSFKAELRGLMQTLQQTVGHVYGDTCDADLGDARCKLNIVPFTFSGTVSANSDNRTFTATMTQPTGYFSRGNLTWLTGLNAGRVGEVRNYIAPNSFVLQLLAPFNIAAGDTFSVVAGCDKGIATCECTFGNSVNFRGAFTVPGQDRMISGT